MFSWERIKVRGVSTKAQALLDEVRALPTAKLRVARSGIRRLETRRRGREEEKAKPRETQVRLAEPLAPPSGQGGGRV